MICFFRWSSFTNLDWGWGFQVCNVCKKERRCSLSSSGRYQSTIMNELTAYKCLIGLQTMLLMNSTHFL